MSIFEHHDKHNEKHDEKHDEPKPPEPQETHAAQANQPPEQRSDIQPKALTPEEECLARNRHFLLWGA